MKWLLIAAGGVAAWWLWRTGTAARIADSAKAAVGIAGPHAVLPTTVLAAGQQGIHTGYGSGGALTTLAGLPDPNLLAVGTQSPDGRFVVVSGNLTTGGQQWTPVLGGQVPGMFT